MTDREILAAMASMLEPVTTRLDSLQNELAETKAELKQDIAEVKAGLKQDIAEVKAELKQDIAEVKEDTADIKRKVDILYEWTDTIELRVRDLERNTALSSQR